MFPIKCKFESGDTIIDCMIVGFDYINSESYAIVCNVTNGNIFDINTSYLKITDERIIKKED